MTKGRGEGADHSLCQIGWVLNLESSGDNQVVSLTVLNGEEC